MNIRIASIVLMGLLSACDLDPLGRAAEWVRACELDSAPPDISIEACDAVIDAAGSDKARLARAYLFRGLAFGRKPDHEQALKDFSKSLLLVPGDAFVIANRGSVYGMIGDRERAMRDLDEAIRIDPLRFDALGNRSVLHGQAGDFESALVDIDESLRINPQMFPSWDQRCWVRAVLAKDLIGAISDCDRALEIKNDNWNSHNSRGFAHYRLGQFAQSIADYDKAIAGDPKVASSYYVRGLAKRAIGDPGADADIAKSSEMDPSVAVRYASYGIVID